MHSRLLTRRSVSLRAIAFAIHRLLQSKARCSEKAQHVPRRQCVRTPDVPQFQLRRAGNARRASPCQFFEFRECGIGCAGAYFIGFFDQAVEASVEIKDGALTHLTIAPVGLAGGEA
jgi:hypothetical protein